LLIKDHFVSSKNVCLAVLVHEMYEPTIPLAVPEALYFRDLNAIRNFFLAAGWTVDVKNLATDIGDQVLICRNVRDGGRSQILELESRVNELTQTVQDLSSMVHAKFNNPNYVSANLAKIKNKSKHVNKVVKNNDLSLPSDRVPSKRSVSRPRKISKEKDGFVVQANKVKIKHTHVVDPVSQGVKSKMKSVQVDDRYDEVVTTELKPKKWVVKDPSVVKPRVNDRTYVTSDVMISVPIEPSKLISDQAEEVGAQRRRIDFSALSRKKVPPD